MSTILAAAGTRAFASSLASVAADRIVAYHSSAYRTRGLPSVAGLLPWASANEQTLAMLPEILAGASGAPVIATVCANDGLLPRAEMIARLREAGARGVLNAPTVGLLEGTVRAVLEREGLGMDPELALTSEAVEAGLESWVYAFDGSWVRRAVDAGATGIVIHLGITGYPSPVDLAECLEAAAESGAGGSTGGGPAAGRAGAGSAAGGSAAGGSATDGSCEVLLHGGPLTAPAALGAALSELPPDLAAVVTGYMGASVFERAADLGGEMRRWRDTLSAHPRELPS